MVKGIVTYLIRLKNPGFKLDPEVNSSLLSGLLFEKTKSFLRANIRLLLNLNKPSFLFFGKGVKLFHSKKIRFGRFVQIGDYTSLNALGKSGITLGNNVSIGAFSRIIVSTSYNRVGAFIRIGNNAGLGEYAYLGGGGGLEIGDDCIIGQYFSCHPENHLFDNNDMLIRHSSVSRKGIKIGANCWIGSKATILDGVTIGDNCVIAAGAVVNKSFGANCVIGGVPAKILKKRNVGSSQTDDVRLPANPELFL